MELTKYLTLASGLDSNHTLTLTGLGLVVGRWDFGLCSQQQLIRVILLLLHQLASLICTAISIQSLQAKETSKKSKCDIQAPRSGVLRRIPPSWLCF